MLCGCLTGCPPDVEFYQIGARFPTEVAQMDVTFDRIQSIVADLLDVDPARIVPEARFREDLGADSLDLVELIMELEEQFGGSISDEDAQKIKTVGQAIEYLKKSTAES
jgi:acyl carrier protein